MSRIVLFRAPNRKAFGCSRDRRGPRLLSSLSMGLIGLATSIVLSQGAGIQWQQLSSKKGDLPAPGPSTQQTGAMVADLDKDGLNDFVLSFRKVAPALVWYRRMATGWDRS